MSTIRTTVQNRRIDVIAPETIPDGTDVLVEVTPVPSERIGIDESEWRDDAAALADWDVWIHTFESPELTPEEEAAFARFQNEMKRFNIAAVRKQMEGFCP